MRGWLTYIAAFLCGLGGAYVVLRIGAEAMFGNSAGLGFLISTVFPPLAGLSLFALVYGLAKGRPLRGKFWSGSIALVAGAYLLGGLLLTSGVASLGAVAGIMVLAIFVGGWSLMEWSGDA